MTESSSFISRRGVLLASASAVLVTATPWSMLADGVREIRMEAAPGRAPLVGKDPQTEVLGYDGKVPGPTLRLRQGQSVRIIVENRLDEDTTVHWHGLRVPNAMDGVPGLTQPPIKPRATSAYES